jgi:hypothetical protein
LSKLGRVSFGGHLFNIRLATVAPTGEDIWSRHFKIAIPCDR